MQLPGQEILRQVQGVRTGMYLQGQPAFSQESALALLTVLLAPPGRSSSPHPPSFQGAKVLLLATGLHIPSTLV